MSSIRRKRVIQKLFSPFEQRSGRGKAIDSAASKQSKNEQKIITHDILDDKISSLTTALSKLQRDVAEMSVANIELIDAFLENQQQLKQIVKRIECSQDKPRPKSFALDGFLGHSNILIFNSFRAKSCYEPDFDISEHFDLDYTLEKDFQRDRNYIREKFVSKSLKTYVIKENIPNKLDYQTRNDDADSGTWDEVAVLSDTLPDCENQIDEIQASLKSANTKNRSDSRKKVKRNPSKDDSHNNENAKSENFLQQKTKKGQLSHCTADRRPDSLLFFGSQSINIDDVIKTNVVDSQLKQESLVEKTKNKTEEKAQTKSERAHFKEQEYSQKQSTKRIDNAVNSKRSEDVGGYQHEYPKTKKDADLTKVAKNVHKTVPLQIDTNISLETDKECKLQNVETYAYKTKLTTVLPVSFLKKNEAKTAKISNNIPWPTDMDEKSKSPTIDVNDKYNLRSANLNGKNKSLRINVNDNSRSSSPNVNSINKYQWTDESDKNKSRLANVNCNKITRVEHVTDKIISQTTDNKRILPICDSKTSHNEKAFQNTSKNTDTKYLTSASDTQIARKSSRYEQRRLSSVRRKISDVETLRTQYRTRSRNQEERLSVKERREMYLRALEKL